MCDFEDALRTYIKATFSEAKILGCDFHFCKALWKNAGAFKLKNQAMLPKVKFVINALTII